jgi:hypothetical protein
MPDTRRLIIIAKQRAFNEEKWKQLLMAMAYYLHEQRQTQAIERTTKADAPTKT